MSQTWKQDHKRKNKDKRNSKLRRHRVQQDELCAPETKGVSSPHYQKPPANRATTLGQVPEFASGKEEVLMFSAISQETLELYDRCKEVIDLVEPNLSRELTRAQLIEAGNIAERLAEKDPNNAIKWYTIGHDIRAHIPKIYTDAHDIYSLNFASNCSQKLFELHSDLETKIKWAETCVREKWACGIHAATLGEHDYSGCVLRFAGDAALATANIFDGEARGQWLRISYFCHLMSSKESEIAKDFFHASHTYAAAAKDAEDLAELMKNVSDEFAWLGCAYSCEVKATKLSTEKFHSLRCHIIARDIAEQIAHILTNTDAKLLWHMLAYKNGVNAILLSEQIEPNPSIAQLTRTANAAEAISHLTTSIAQKILWGEASYYLRIKAADRQSLNAPVAAAYTLNFASSIISYVAKVCEEPIQKKEYYLKAYDACMKAMELTDKTELRFIASYTERMKAAKLIGGAELKFIAKNYGFLGEYALEVAHLETNGAEKVKWLRLAYDHRMTASNLSQSFDGQHSRICWGLARAIETELNGLTSTTN